MEHLYIYDHGKREIGKFEIIKETEKQYKINYRTGIDVINPENAYIWSNIEWIAKTEINAKGIYSFERAVATNLKELKRMIMNHLIDFKKICYTLGNDENDDLIVVPQATRNIKTWELYSWRPGSNDEHIKFFNGTEDQVKLELKKLEIKNKHSFNRFSYMEVKK